ncbi:MAG: hypothetical protein ACK5YB_16640 [Burkholderiales bacterium]
MATALIILASALIALAVLAYQQNQRASTLEAQAEAQARTTEVSTRLRLSSEANAEDTRRKLEVARHFAWETVFDAIEDVTSPEIEMIAVSPSKSTGAVSIRAYAKSREAMLQFVTALENRTGLSRVHIARFETKVIGALILLEFEVVAQLPLNTKRDAARTGR